MFKFFHWLVTSSENPNNTSLALKGILGTITTVVLLVAPFFHAKVDSDQLTAITDAIIQAVLAFFAVVGAIASVVGMIRKISLTGKNPEELQTNPMKTPTGAGTPLLTSDNIK